MGEIIGVDIGGTKCSVVLGKSVDNYLAVLEKSAFPTADYPAPEQALGKIRVEIERLLAKHNPVAIGISCGGPLDSTRGVIMSPPNLPGWDEVPICNILEQKFGIPAAIRNDADACAVAEWRFGAGRGTEDFIFLTCGTGLGAGMILGGRLYSGRHGMAGEIGHWRMRAHGPIGYGKAGSLEGFCSGSGISMLAGQWLSDLKKRGERHPFFMELFDEGIAPTARDVFRHARENDPFSIEIIKKVGVMLGHGIAKLIDLLNPEVVVGGSIFTRNYDLLYPIVRRVVDKEALPVSAANCRILPSELGESLGDMAALAVAPT